MTKSENQKSMEERAIEDADGLAERLTDILVDQGDGDLLSNRGDRIIQFLQALDLQVLGACRADERLKPLLKLNVSCDAAEDRLLAYLSQHFEPSEIGMLARCLLIPLVSIRVGKIRKEGTLLCPTSVRGNLSITLLPASDLCVSFTGDDGRMERLFTLISNSQPSDIAVEQIPADPSGRSFLLRIPNCEIFYFWCSEKSKLLGSELLMKMNDLLKTNPSLAELTGISKSRLDSFASYLHAYLGSSVSVTRGAPVSLPSDTSAGSSEFYRAALSSSSKPLRSKNIASQSYQASLSPRSSSFKEGLSKNSSSLRSVGREKLRRWDNQVSVDDSLTFASSITTDGSSSSHSQNLKTHGSTIKQLVTPNLSESVGKPTLPPLLCPISQVTTLASSLFTPYYCWCPPIASTLQYTVSPPQLPFSSSEPPTLPPLSSSIPVNKASSVFTPSLDLPCMPNLDFPPLLPEPLIRLPLPMSSSPQIATFTPLVCDPIVHIPVIDVCSSGQGYLVSAGSAISNTISPLLPNFVNPLIQESDSIVEEGARETLRRLIGGSSQTSPQLMDVLPSVFMGPDERQGILATGSRGLYSGTSDIGIVATGLANVELGSELKKLIGPGQGTSADKVETLGGSEDNDSLSNLREDQSE